MARFTVADCMENIPNRFEMTLSASVRARQIEKSGNSFVDSENKDKPSVLALREIASKLVDSSILKYLDE